MINLSTSNYVFNLMSTADSKSEQEKIMEILAALTGKAGSEINVKDLISSILGKMDGDTEGSMLTENPELAEEIEGLVKEFLENCEDCDAQENMSELQSLDSEITKLIEEYRETEVAEEIVPHCPGGMTPPEGTGDDTDLLGDQTDAPTETVPGTPESEEPTPTDETPSTPDNTDSPTTDPVTPIDSEFGLPEESTDDVNMEKLLEAFVTANENLEAVLADPDSTNEQKAEALEMLKNSLTDLLGAGSGTEEVSAMIDEMLSETAEKVRSGEATDAMAEIHSTLDNVIEKLNGLVKAPADSGETTETEESADAEVADADETTSTDAVDAPEETAETSETDAPSATDEPSEPEATDATDAADATDTMTESLQQIMTLLTELLSVLEKFVSILEQASGESEKGRGADLGEAMRPGSERTSRDGVNMNLVLAELAGLKSSISSAPTGVDSANDAEQAAAS